MPRHRGRDEDLPAYEESPRPGDIWWCKAEALGFGDGKTRPVLVVAVDSGGLDVVPLTTRRPAEKAIAVSHRGGLSWMTEAHRSVQEIDLIASLGGWSGYEAWRRGRR